MCPSRIYDFQQRVLPTIVTLPLFKQFCEVYNFQKKHRRWWLWRFSLNKIISGLRLQKRALSISSYHGASSTAPPIYALHARALIPIGFGLLPPTLATPNPFGDNGFYILLFLAQRSLPFPSLSFSSGLMTSRSSGAASHALRSHSLLSNIYSCTAMVTDLLRHEKAVSFFSLFTSSCTFSHTS